MHKLLNIFAMAGLIVTSISTVVACDERKNGDSTTQQKFEYQDGELDQIKNKAYQEYVKKSLPIAKMLLSARHENLNIYGQSILNWFLQSTSDKYKTKNNAVIDLLPVKTMIKKTRPRRQIQLDTLIKWYEGKNKESVWWAYSDTGALSNYLLHNDWNGKISKYGNNSNDSVIDSSRTYLYSWIGYNNLDHNYIDF